MSDNKTGWQRMVGRLQNWLGSQATAEPAAELVEPKGASVAHAKEEEGYTAVEKKWRDAMPVCLLDHFPAMRHNLDTLDFMSIRLALLEEYPEPTAQALALFGWYGHGAGNWMPNKYPAYETVPEQLLMELPLAALVGALQDNPLDPAHLEGAARFFSGDLFLGMRGGEAAQLPPDLIAALQAHVSHDPAKSAQLKNLSAKNQV